MTTTLFRIDYWNGESRICADIDDYNVKLCINEKEARNEIYRLICDELNHDNEGNIRIYLNKDEYFDSRPSGKFSIEQILENPIILENHLKLIHDEEYGGLIYQPDHIFYVCGDFGHQFKMICINLNLENIDPVKFCKVFNEIHEFKSKQF